METFEVDVEGKTYEVDAPDANTAWKWANATHRQSNQVKPAVQSSPAPVQRDPEMLAERSGVREALLGTPESRARVRDVGMSAVAQGAAGAIDSLLNAPSNIWNLSKAAAGTVAGLAGRPDLMPSVSQGPNYAQRGMQAIGLINPEAAPQGTAESIFAGAGRGLGSMLVGPTGSGSGITRAADLTNGIPTMLSQNIAREVGGRIATPLAMGAGSGAVGQAVEQGTGSQIAGQMASMLTPLAAVKAKSYADARTQRLAERESANAVRDESLRMGRDEGMLVAPGDIASTGVKGWINRRLESFGGKDAIRQEINVRNQEMTNAVAQRVLGLPKGTAVTEKLLDDYREVMAAPYREVAALPTLPPSRVQGIRGYPLFGPTPQSAADALKELRQARIDSNAQWKDFQANKKVESRDNAVALDKRIESLEGHIEKTAIAAGRPDLIPALQEARTKIAQSWDIDRALNTGNADVSARILQGMLNKGRPLGGELKSVAEFTNAFPHYMTEGARVHMPGVSKSDWYAGIGMGMAGAALTGGPGGIVGLLPLAHGPVRNMLLSGPYQQLMGSPNYTPGIATSLASRLPAMTEQQAAQQGLLLGRGLQQ